MQFRDKLTIDGKRRTTDGYLAINGRVARGGNVQLYTGAEVGKPEKSTVRVYRPADEVFSDSTMKSFAHRPVTLGHPSESVTSTNWRDVAKGWTDGEVVRDGEFVRVSMLLADAEAINAVDGGIRELSMGYDCCLDWTSGVSPAGEAYDAVQRGIRSNHLAIVPAARGGHELRLGDGAASQQGKTITMLNDEERKSMYDSVRRMTVDEAAKLPIFDNVRGLWIDGMPAEKYWAIVAGASYEPVVTDAQHRAEAHRDHMIAGMTHNGNLGDGNDLESARAHMLADQRNAWKGR